MNFATKWSRNTSMPFPTMPTLSRDPTERATSSILSFSLTHIQLHTKLSTGLAAVTEKGTRTEEDKRGGIFVRTGQKKKMPF